MMLFLYMGFFLLFFLNLFTVIRGTYGAISVKRGLQLFLSSVRAIYPSKRNEITAL
jgi:small neutral amino acid transporter SnatA (MarC family)